MFTKRKVLLTIFTLNTCFLSYGAEKSDYKSLLPKKAELRNEIKVTEVSHVLKEVTAHKVNAKTYNSNHHCHQSPDVDYYTGMLPDIRQHNTHVSSCVYGYR